MVIVRVNPVLILYLMQNKKNMLIMNMEETTQCTEDAEEIIFILIMKLFIRELSI